MVLIHGSNYAFMQDNVGLKSGILFDVCLSVYVHPSVCLCVCLSACLSYSKNVDQQLTCLLLPASSFEPTGLSFRMRFSCCGVGDLRAW